MERIIERRRVENGLTGRQLALLFLVAVAVCAIFFSLGFLVGFNERAPRAAAITEQVTRPGAVPPIVNPPLAAVPPTGKEARSASASRLPSSGAAERVPQEDISGSKSVNAPISSSSQATSGISSDQAMAENLNPESSPGKEVTSGFTIQVAATATKQDAEAVVARLKARGYPVFLVTPEYAHVDDNLFRVQVGPYTSRENAEKARQKLAQEGFKEPFIRH